MKIEINKREMKKQKIKECNKIIFCINQLNKKLEKKKYN